jgi:hypothetical protein
VWARCRRRGRGRCRNAFPSLTVHVILACVPCRCRRRVLVVGADTELEVGRCRLATRPRTSGCRRWEARMGLRLIDRRRSGNDASRGSKSDVHHEFPAAARCVKRKTIASVVPC